MHPESVGGGGGGRKGAVTMKLCISFLPNTVQIPAIVLPTQLVLFVEKMDCKQHEGL